MAWREQLGTVTLNGREFRPGAYFRGVPFLVESSELSGGRRVAHHEFPLRDVAYNEDLGRKARSFPVEGYVLGEDYLGARDQLISALEDEGPGELVHPYYGTRRVSVVDFRVRETTSEGGIARFGITFEETEVAPPFPSASPAGEDLVAASADEAQEAAGGDFLATYDVSGQPLGALESLANVVATAAAALETALGPVTTATQQLAAMKRGLDKLTLDTLSLVRQPGLILGGFVEAVEVFTVAPLAPGLWLPAVLRAYSFAPTSARPAAVTSVRRREQVNYDALARFIRTLLLIRAARLAPTEAWDCYNAAVAARDALCERLDEQMDGAADLSFAALGQLRADLVRGVPGEDSDLPRLIGVTPERVVPSLVLAYRLYGNLDLEGDLVTRNRLVRPGFVPGGSELEVLST